MSEIVPTPQGDLRSGELIEKVALRTGLSRKQVRLVMSAIALEITFALANNRRVHWRNFGIFELRYYKATSRTMPDGRTVQVPGKFMPVFKLSSFFQRNVARLGAGRIPDRVVR